MYEITTFDYDDGYIRVVKDDRQNTWWVAKDVAESLGYIWKGVAGTIRHIPEEWRGVHSVQTPSGVQEMITLSEQGLYFFLGRSDKPASIPFQKWIAGTVMPSIRRTGSYSIDVPKTLPEALRAYANEIDKRVRLEGELSATQQSLEVVAKQITINAPKVDYCEQVLKNPAPLVMTQIAKDYGMSAQALNKILFDLRIQFKRNGQWVLYAHLDDKGYTISDTIMIPNGRGGAQAKVVTQWTQKGREYLYQTLKGIKLLPRRVK
jgi:anti-repressor protein